MEKSASGGSSKTKNKIRTEYIKDHQQNKKLVASELGNLFANYLGDPLFAPSPKIMTAYVTDSKVSPFSNASADEKHFQKSRLEVILSNDS